MKTQTSFAIIGLTLIELRNVQLLVNVMRHSPGATRNP